MDLKTRKQILNFKLPKFSDGGSLLDLANSITTAQGMQSLHPSQIVPTDLKTDVLNANVASKVKPSAIGGAGNFLKSNAGGIMNIVSSGLDFFDTLGSVSKNTLTSDLVMGSGGQSEESVNGISFQQSKVDEAGIQNQIDATAKAGTMASMGKGAALGGAVGSVIPGLGTVAGGAIGGIIGGIAGLFGSSKARREAERQKRIAINRTNASNTLNRETALTIGLRNEFNRENRTDISQSLFHAEEGIEGAVNPRTGATYKKHIVNTAYGKVKAPQNAWVSKGEVIRSKDGSLYRVQSGDNDTARAYLQNGDSVYSKKIINPETGNSIADDAASYAMAGQLDRLDMNLNVGRMMKEAGRRKTNLLPEFLGGTNKYKQLPGFKGGLSDYMGGVTATIIDNMMFTGDMKSPFKTGYELGNGQNTLPDIVKNVNALIDAQTGDHGVQMYAPGGYSSLPAQKTYTSRMQSPRPDKSSAIVPEITIPGSEEHVGGAVGIAGNGNGGAKKPGLFGKIKGVLGGLGGNIDLGNIVQLANAYSIAAQRDARAEGLRAPKSFVANPYEQDALQLLNKLHSDYYPVWAQNRELEGRGKSSIMLSGGLSAGQKMLGYMGLTNQTQQNNMAALFEHQGRENALRAQAAKASLEAGNLSATRQQLAYQWDEDMLAKAHAAQENMFETSAYDRQNGLTQFFKNAWEKNQFDRTMNLYESQQKDDHAKTLAIINNLGTKQNPEVKKATIAPQTVATMQKLWNRNPDAVDLGELELPEFAVTPAKKVAKPKVTKRRTVKRGGKK